MTAFVLITRDLTLLDAHSFLRQRYAPIHWLMVAHGVPGALALFLGVFQFSSRLRERYLQVHRVMGRIYVGSVFIAAPMALVVSHVLYVPSLFMASLIQAFGWMAATATALYCVRTGRIQQHREWMMRGYPFAAVFVVVRVLVAIPAIARMGEMGLIVAVWSVIATACFLPSFVIAWHSLAEPSGSGGGRLTLKRYSETDAPPGFRNRNCNPNIRKHAVNGARRPARRLAECVEMKPTSHGIVAPPKHPRPKRMLLRRRACPPKYPTIHATSRG